MFLPPLVALSAAYLTLIGLSLAPFPWILRCPIWFFTAFVFAWSYWCHSQWMGNWKGRHTRNDIMCPSNKKRPPTGHRPTPLAKDSPTEYMYKKQSIQQKDLTTPGGDHAMLFGRKGTVQRSGGLTNLVTMHLSMDHVALSYLDFMWGQIFVGLPQLCNLFFGATHGIGITKLFIMQKLARLGYITLPTPNDPANTVAEMILETSLLIFCVETDDGDTAHFHIPDCYLIDTESNGEICIFGTLSGKVDLKKRRLIENNFESMQTLPEDREEDHHVMNGPLDPADVLLMFLMHLYFIHHPKIHSYANWGVNPLNREGPLRRSSVVTVLFNHFGCNQYWAFSERLRSQMGILQYFFPFHHIITKAQEKPPAHKTSTMEKLVKHSRYGTFLFKVRRFFMAEFVKFQMDPKYEKDFEGIDGESLFIGTVLHSTEHEQTAKLFTCWDMTCCDPKFAAMQEQVRLVKTGFMDCLWATPYNFKMSSTQAHPMLQKVYHFAKTVDREIADTMETCVVR